MLACVFVVLGAGLQVSALEVATKQGTAACGTDPHEFTPLLKEVSAGKDRLSSAEATVQAILKEAEKREEALEALETKRENVAQKAAVQSRDLANEMGEMEALRHQTSKLRQRVYDERCYVDETVNKLDHERAFLRTRRDRLNEEAHNIRDMELENKRLHNSIDSWDYYRLRQEDARLRSAHRRHSKELVAFEQQAKDLERSTGSLQAHMKHYRQDQEDLHAAEITLRSKQKYVLDRQARLGQLEEELGRLEAQVSRNIQLNNEVGQKVKQARANWAQASREAVEQQSSTLHTVHARFQDRDRLASERQAAIESLASDLKGTEGVLKGVKSELGARDTSVAALRGAIQETQDQLKACQDKRLKDHLADDIEEFSAALPPNAEPSQEDRFMSRMGDLAESVADSSEPVTPEGPEEPSDAVMDKIGKLAELLKP